MTDRNIARLIDERDTLTGQVNMQADLISKQRIEIGHLKRRCAALEAMVGRAGIRATHGARKGQKA